MSDSLFTGYMKINRNSSSLTIVENFARYHISKMIPLRFFAPPASILLSVNDTKHRMVSPSVAAELLVSVVWGRIPILKMS